MRVSKEMINGLKAVIPGGISIGDFDAVTGIGMQESERVLDGFVGCGAGTREDNSYFFEESDRVRLAVLMLEAGAPVESVSESLHWRDFEGMTAEILASRDFAVVRNMMLKDPRMEIDVVGIRLGVAVLVDCKHWRRYSTSALATAVKKQVERTRQYVAKTPGAVAVPVIVTLFQDRVSFIRRVPIVPVSKLPSFIDEFYGNLDQMESIGTDLT